MDHQLKYLVINNQNNILLGKTNIGLNNNYICLKCRNLLNQLKNKYSTPLVKTSIYQCS